MSRTRNLMLIGAGVVGLGAAAWFADHLILGNGVHVETND
ncbi:HlyD family secretion protein, partial [Acetobacter sp. DmW_125126]